jgi:hypothetical protein
MKKTSRRSRRNKIQIKEVKQEEKGRKREKK